MGEEALEGGGVGEAERELEGEGCGWASIQPASHFPPASPLPVLAGALEAGAWPRRTQCLSVLVKGGAGEATAPPPPAEACGGGGAQALLVRWLEAHT